MISQNRPEDDPGRSDSEGGFSNVGTHPLKKLRSVLVEDVVVDHLSGAADVVQVSRAICDELDAEILCYVRVQTGISIVCGVRTASSFLSAIPRMRGVVSWRLLPVPPDEKQPTRWHRTERSESGGHMWWASQYAVCAWSMRSFEVRWQGL